MTELENANLAVNGLRALGRLFKQLADGDADFKSQMEAVAAFVKPLVLEMAFTNALGEAAPEQIERALQNMQGRDSLLKEMEAVAAALDGGAEGEEKEALKKQMKNLLEAHSQMIIENIASYYEALGAVKEEVEAALKENHTLLALLSLIQGTEGFYRYL
ncbi:hypothetical protein Efla_000663 [Eimeria flavescens]